MHGLLYSRNFLPPMPTPSDALVAKAEELNCHVHFGKIQPGSDRCPESFLVTRNGTHTTLNVPTHLAVPEVLQFLVEEDDRKQLRACTPQLHVLPDFKHAL